MPMTLMAGSTRTSPLSTGYTLARYLSCPTFTCQGKNHVAALTCSLLRCAARVGRVLTIKRNMGSVMGHNAIDNVDRVLEGLDLVYMQMVLSSGRCRMSGSPRVYCSATVPIYGQSCETAFCCAGDPIAVLPDSRIVLASHQDCKRCADNGCSLLAAQ